MAETIKGINVVIGAETTGLSKALADVDKKSKSIQSELKQVEKLLKFDPSNVEAIAQKQKLLTEQIEATTERLNRLKAVEQQVQEQFQRGDISEAQYRAFRREIEFTQGSLEKLRTELAAMEQEQQRIAVSTKQLEILFAATEKSVEDFADALGDKLTNAIKSGKASADQLDQAIEKIGQAALGANIDLDKMRAALKSVDDGNSIENVRKELNALSKEAGEAQKSVKDLGLELENVAGALVAGGGIAGVIEQALDTSSLDTKIEVSFDVPEESKQAIKEAVRSIEAYGVDAEEALEGVRRQWALNKQASDEQNASVVEGAAVIAKAYSGIDFIELIQEINEIGKSLGISNEEALALTNALLKVGFPPEQLDIISEYGTQLKMAGFNAREIQAIFVAGIETGTWNIDNLLDGLKEGRIRLAEFGQEVPKATQELLTNTQISTQQLQTWGQAVAAGGEAGRTAMQEVAQALISIKDETTRNALGVQIFGTMWEDQGTNIIDTILNMENHLATARENQDALNRAVEELDSDPAVRLQQAFKDLKSALEPVLLIVADIISKIAEWTSNNPTLAATITAVATAIGIIIGACTALSPILIAISTAAGAMGISIGALVAPIGIAIAAIAGLVAAGVLIYKNWDKIKETLDRVWGAIVDFFTKTIPEAIEKGLKWFSELPGKVAKFMNELPGKIGYALGVALGNIIKFGIDAINWAIAEVPRFIEQIITFYMELPGKIWEWLVKAFNKVVEWGVNLIKWAKAEVPNIISTIIGFFMSMPGKLFEIGANMVKGLWDGIKSMISWIQEKISDFIGGIVSSVEGVLGIKSPSKVFAGIGENISLGLLKGITKQKLAIETALSGLLTPNLALAGSTTNNYSYGGNTINITVQDGEDLLRTLHRLGVRLP